MHPTPPRTQKVDADHPCTEHETAVGPVLPCHCLFATPNHWAATCVNLRSILPLHLCLMHSNGLVRLTAVCAMSARKLSATYYKEGFVRVVALGAHWQIGQLANGVIVSCRSEMMMPVLLEHFVRERG